MSDFTQLQFGDSMSMLSEILARLVYDAPDRLRRIISSNSDQIILQIPRWIHYHVSSGMLSTESKLVLSGINVIIGYENSLVLYHKDYTYTMDEDLIHKLALMPGIKSKLGENISEIIFSIMPVNIRDEQNSQQN